MVLWLSLYYISKTSCHLLRELEEPSIPQMWTEQNDKGMWVRMTRRTRTLEAVSAWLALLDNLWMCQNFPFSVGRNLLFICWSCCRQESNPAACSCHSSAPAVATAISGDLRLNTHVKYSVFSKRVVPDNRCQLAARGLVLKFPPVFSRMNDLWAGNWQGLLPFF